MLIPLLLRAVLVICLFVSTPSFAATQVLFSPNGGCQQAIIDQISRANESIDIAIYSFTSREIAQALVEAHGREVVVRVVMDKLQESGTYSKSRYLVKHGLVVKIHVGAGIMHNKFAVIDGKALITGSYNWTANAENNNEENLFILNDQEIIKKFQERFETLWQGGRVLTVLEETKGGGDDKKDTAQ